MIFEIVALFAWRFGWPGWAGLISVMILYEAFCIHDVMR